MRQVSIFVLILGVSFLLITTSSNAQIHKVKISELKERTVNEYLTIGKNTAYQLPKVTNPVFTNSPGTLVGRTFWDSQHNGTMSRMVALDSIGGIHFAWMNLESGGNPSSNRYVYYNYLDPAGNWLAPGGGAGDSAQCKRRFYGHCRYFTRWKSSVMFPPGSVA